MEVWRNLAYEEQQRQKHQHSTHHIAIAVAILGNIAAKQHTRTNTYIPTGKICRICRCSARVGSIVDKERIVGREHRAVTVTKEECRNEIYGICNG